MWTSESIWTKVNKGDIDDCWTWQGKPNTSGRYYRVSYQGKKYTLHRLIFFLYNGHWPNVCRHTCDNTLCVNPNHLLDGTQYDNVQDIHERGRFVSGYSQRTHCSNGHEFSEENTYRWKNKRVCRKCRAMHVNNNRKKKMKDA